MDNAGGLTEYRSDRFFLFPRVDSIGYCGPVGFVLSPGLREGDGGITAQTFVGTLAIEDDSLYPIPGSRLCNPKI